MNDYFIVENALVTKIKTLLPQIPESRILSGSNLKELDSNTQRYPAVYVLFYDDEPRTTPNTGRSQAVTQHWLVILINRNVKTASAKESREDTGQLIALLLNGLQGWTPADVFTPLVRVKPNFPSSAYKDGFFYFRALFSTTTHF